MALSEMERHAIGYVAAAFTTGAFVPQAWKTFRSRSAQDLSYGMLVTFSIGLSLWLLYGVLLGSWPLIAANGITLVLNLLIIAMKARFTRPPL